RPRQQQLFAIGGEEAEAEAAVLLAEADEARALAGFLLGRAAALHLTAERTQADRLAQLTEERRGDPAGLGRTGEQDVLQVRRPLHQRVVTLAGLAQLVVEQLEQTLLGLAPGQAIEQLLAELGLLGRGGERLVEGEQVGIVRVL